MRRSVSILVAALVVAALIPLTTSLGMTQIAPPSTASERKLASRVTPNYPPLARKTHIHGIVRLEVVVRANGTVRSTRVLGGNPVLIEAAIEAVDKWKFEPAQTETTEKVQLAFGEQ